MLRPGRCTHLIMLEVPLTFRSTRGGFEPSFTGFVYLPARKKAAMYLQTLKLQNIQGGVKVGLRLSFLYYGLLLQRCGDVALQGPDQAGRTTGGRQG